ncbi:DUF1036 domain-containing protein [Aerosakkonema funiforme]|uniref:DUF1036 domain-containing protein n=1 Tax=Aerosakkonema funiforme TaxID=1246630 RepID=UPI0035B929A6
MLKKLLISSASILISSAALVFATPARADFVVCNRAAGRAYVAISWTDQQGQTWSRGWLQLDPGNCASAYRGRVSNAEIGVYAETPTGVVASGNTRRCVIWVQVQASWNIRDAANSNRCKGNGREMKAFETIRTGGSPDYTYEVYD